MPPYMKHLPPLFPFGFMGLLVCLAISKSTSNVHFNICNISSVLADRMMQYFELMMPFQASVMLSVFILSDLFAKAGKFNDKGQIESVCFKRYFSR